MTGNCLTGLVAGTGIVCALGLAAATAVTAAGRSAAPPPAKVTADPLPGDGLRTVAVRRYRMSGRIRPLLFWFGRDDIGMARITWRADDDGARAYELLVGTDPSKAPRALNKWGFIAEQAQGGDGRLLALMTGADAASYDEAAADATRPPSAGDFRAIVGRVNGGTSSWKTARIATASAFSVHDVDAALDRIRLDAAAADEREAPRPAETRPGFLVALAEMIDRGAGLAPGVPGARDARGHRVRYVFGQGVYELTLRSAERATVDLEGLPTAAIRSSFDIRTVATGAHTRFEILFGDSDGLRNVPVAAEWQPKWWLKVELRLLEAGRP